MTWFMSILRKLLKPGAEDLAAQHALAPGIKFIGPVGDLPTSRKEVIEMFGDPGFAKPSKRFQRRRMTIATKLPGHWNNSSHKLFIHELAEPYLREALRLCEVHDVLREIDTLGCYTHRHQRHDPGRPLSYHSWGIALDINPYDNKVKRYERGGARPKAFSEEWCAQWPNGVSQRLVECFEDAGWTWGGRWPTFVDGMHFQLKK